MAKRMPGNSYLVVYTKKGNRKDKRIGKRGTEGRGESVLDIAFFYGRISRSGHYGNGERKEIFGTGETNEKI